MKQVALSIRGQAWGKVGMRVGTPVRSGKRGFSQQEEFRVDGVWKPRRITSEERRVQKGKSTTVGEKECQEKLATYHPNFLNQGSRGRESNQRKNKQRKVSRGGRCKKIKKLIESSQHR